MPRDSLQENKRDPPPIAMGMVLLASASQRRAAMLERSGLEILQVPLRARERHRGQRFSARDGRLLARRRALRRVIVALSLIHISEPTRPY